jgi:hypothetical protein
MLQCFSRNCLFTQLINPCNLRNLWQLLSLLWATALFVHLQPLNFYKNALVDFFDFLLLPLNFKKWEGYLK